MRHWNFNGSTILSTFYALPYIGIKHSLHKLYKCMLLYFGLYIRGINLLFMWCVEILWLVLITIHVVKFLNRGPSWSAVTISLCMYPVLSEEIRRCSYFASYPFHSNLNTWILPLSNWPIWNLYYVRYNLSLLFIFWWNQL